MAIKFKLDSKGLNADLKKFSQRVQSAFEKTFDEAGGELTSGAKMYSSALPTISGSIRLTKADDGFEVSTGNGMANPELTAYYEFGTGNYAAATVSGMPDDWVRMAAQYIKNKKGRLPAHPYLYRAFQDVKKDIDRKVVEKIG